MEFVVEYCYFMIGGRKGMIDFIFLIECKNLIGSTKILWEK